MGTASSTKKLSLIFLFVNMLTIPKTLGNLGLIPGLGRSPGEGNGNPLQYSCLENPHGKRSLVGYSPWGRKESDMTEPLSLTQTIQKEKKNQNTVTVIHQQIGQSRNTGTFKTLDEHIKQLRDKCA